jgi:hypothetical protein
VRPTIQIYDLGTTMLADISGIAFEPSVTVAHNLARVLQFSAFAGHTLLTTLAGDGFPNLDEGDRKIVVWDGGDTPGVDDPIFHGRVFLTERVGDGTSNIVSVTAYQPMMELGYEADDRAGRPVRGSSAQPVAGTPFGHYDGNFIDPLFASSEPGQAEISGPDLILQVLTNSQHTDGESGPAPGEGPLPIALTGTFDTVVGVGAAVDLTCELQIDWPIMIGDFIQSLVETNVVDVYERPLNPGTGLNLAGAADPYIMVELSSVSKLGSDKSATVHFDYWTGSHNAKGCRLLRDFSTVCNKLYDNLGPRLTKERWKGLIAPNTAETASLDTPVAASRARYGGPPGATHPGTFMWIRAFDTLGNENSSRPLYLALWLAEQGLRLDPRGILYITPAIGEHSLYTAPQDFEVGDEVAINTGTEFGVTLAEKQRVYGYTKSWDRQGVPSLSQIVTSADVA